MFIVAMIPILIFKFITKTENKISKLKVKKDFIYIRDVDSPLSPASVSYLVNNKLELKKDIVANILSLVSKKAILIKDNFKMIANNSKEKLTEDEEYIFNWLFNNLKFNKKEFTNIIKRSLRGYIYTKRKLIVRSTLFFAILWGIFILMGALDLFGIQISKLSSEILGISTFGIFLLIVFLLMYESWTGDKENPYFSYTKAGLEEITNWDRFRKFLEDFGRLQDYELESIIIWDRYLAYGVALNINKKYQDIKIKNMGHNTDLNIHIEIEKEIENKFFN